MRYRFLTEVTPLSQRASLLAAILAYFTIMHLYILVSWGAVVGKKTDLSLFSTSL